VALIEHHGPVRGITDPDVPGMRSGNPPSYEALRGRNPSMSNTANGDKEYHDLAADPDELHNSFAPLPGKQQEALHAQR